MRLEPTDASTDLSFSSSFAYVVAISLTQHPKVLHVSAFVLHQFCCSNLSVLSARQETTKHFIGPGIPSAKTKHFTSTTTFDFCETRLKRGEDFQLREVVSLDTRVPDSGSASARPLRTPRLCLIASAFPPGRQGRRSPPRLSGRDRPRSWPCPNAPTQFLICQQEEFHPSGVFLPPLPLSEIS